MQYTIYITHNITDPKTYSVMVHNDTTEKVVSDTSFIRTHAEAMDDAQEAASRHRSNFWDMSTAAPIVDLTKKSS